MFYRKAKQHSMEKLGAPRRNAYRELANAVPLSSTVEYRAARNLIQRGTRRWHFTRPPPLMHHAATLPSHRTLCCFFSHPPPFHWGDTGKHTPVLPLRAALGHEPSSVRWHARSLWAPGELDHFYSHPWTHPRGPQGEPDLVLLAPPGRTHTRWPCTTTKTKPGLIWADMSSTLCVGRTHTRAHTRIHTPMCTHDILISFFIQPVLRSFDIGPSACLGSSLPSCVRVDGSDTKGPVRSRASNCKIEMG